MQPGKERTVCSAKGKCLKYTCPHDTDRNRTHAPELNRDFRDKTVVEWLETVPEEVLATMRDEVTADEAWDQRFAETQDELGELVRRAKEEVARGDVLPYDPANRPAS